MLRYIIYLFTASYCNLGTYRNITGARAANECIPCDSGYYCPSVGLTNPHQECNAGHYCESGSPEPSPSGQTYGYLCPVGHYCPKGTPNPQPCPRGTYQPSTRKYLIITEIFLTAINQMGIGKGTEEKWA